MRLFWVVFACAVASHAADTQVVLDRCIKAEIGFVDSLQGSWQDQSYRNRTLVKHLPVCSDSKLVRLEDANYSQSNYLQITPVIGEPLRFDCAQQKSCQDGITFTDINKKLDASLRGMSVLDSLKAAFSKRQGHETSTISRGLTEEITGVRMQNAVVRSGEILRAAAIFPAGPNAGQPDEIHTFDLCLNAETHKCEDTLPQSRPYKPGEANLPFGKLPPGLHILYEVKTLPGDTVAIRTENRVFILAADPSWNAEDLDAVRTQLALDLMADIPADGLDSELVALGVTLSHPRQ